MVLDSLDQCAEVVGSYKYEIFDVVHHHTSQCSLPRMTTVPSYHALNHHTNQADNQSMNRMLFNVAKIAIAITKSAVTYKKA